MDILSREELQYLFTKKDPFCVSLFLPTHRAGPESEQGRIQLKDLLRNAQARLAEAGLGRTAVRELLAPAQQLAQKSYFWRSQGDGLAVFLARGYFRYFRLPLRLQELVIVTDRFDITPLLPLWTSEERFLLLALSRNQVRLFEGTRYGIVELDLKGIPRSLHEALEQGVDESQRQQHTVRPSVPADSLLFFRHIDKGLHKLLEEHRLPLVLAGVDDALRLYREANTYSGLLERSVSGNPDKLSPAELHAGAAEVVHAYYDQVRNNALVRYRERPDAARTSQELQQILAASYQGRIYYLFVAAGVQKWGVFDPEQNAVSVHENPQPGDEDLVNIAVIRTILHGGTVYPLALAEMPEETSVAALFRY